MKQKDQFNAIAEKYYVQIRGIHGEHTETDDGVFDISNRRRLGRSEKQLVQDMIDGVHALIDAEKALWTWETYLDTEIWWFNLTIQGEVIKESET